MCSTGTGTPAVTTSMQAGAIFLIRDLAHIYEGSEDHPFGPTIDKPQTGTGATGPSAIPDSVPVPVGEVKNLLVALDIAADYNRDRAELCADCADQSCPTCESRFREAQAYDRLYAPVDPAGRRLGHRKPPRTGRPARAHGRPGQQAGDSGHPTRVTVWVSGLRLAQGDGSGLVDLRPHPLGWARPFLARSWRP